MCRFSRRARWLAALRNLLLGILLGGFQLVLMGEALSLWRLHYSWWLYVGIGAVSYLLVPGYAGFFTAQQTGDANTGVGAGCLVGGASIIIAFISFWVVTILFQAPAPVLQPPGPPPYPIDTVGIPASSDIIIFLFEVMGGTVVTVIGSSIGEAWGLNHYLIRAQNQSRAELGRRG